MDDVRERIEQAQYARTLGIQVEEVGETSSRLLLPYQDGNSNPGRALHGGVTASLLTAAGRAVAEAALGAEAGPFHTAHMDINYLAAPIGQAIRAEATLLRKGKELCFTEIAIATTDGKPVARGTTVVRARFGADAAEPVLHPGHDPAWNDPGAFGGFMHERVPFLRGLGVRVEHMGDRRARIRLPYAERNADAAGTHEGAILALLDTTGSMASWAGIKPGPYRSSTVALHAQMTALPGEEDLLAYGTLAQRDREIFWADVEIATASTNRLVARGGVLYRIVIPETIPWA